MGGYNKVKEQDWIFTFGYDSPFGQCYIVIYGTYESAREKMFEKFSKKWAYQYESKEAAGVDSFGLTEIK